MILTPRSPPSLKKPSFPGSPCPPLYPPLSTCHGNRLLTSLTPSFMPDVSTSSATGSLPVLLLQSFLGTEHPCKVCQALQPPPVLTPHFQCIPSTVHLVPPLPSSCPFHLPANDCMTSELIPSIPLSDHVLLNQLPHTNRRQPMDASNAEVLARFLCLLYVSENWQGTESTLKRV